MCGETESMFVDASFGAFDRPSRPSEVRSSEVADFLSVGLDCWLAGWIVGWLVGLLAGWLDCWLVGWLVGLLACWLVGWPLPRGWGPPKRGLYGARRGGRLLLLILLLLLRVGTVDVVVRQENGPGVVGTGALPSISSSDLQLEKPLALRHHRTIPDTTNPCGEEDRHPPTYAVRTETDVRRQ